MRKLIILVVLIGLLGGAFVIGDRVAAAYAQDRISEQVSTGLARRNMSSQKPEVTIYGFPFLTQVNAGVYHEIQLDLKDLKGGVLPVPLLEVHAYDVRASFEGLRNGTEKPVATRVTGTGTVSYPDLVKASGLTGVTLSGTGDHVTITGNVPIAGEVQGEAKVSVVDGKVRIEVASLSASNLTAAANKIVNDYRSLLNRTFDIPPLPFSMKLQAVHPTPAGVIVDVAATEVVLG